MTKNFNCKNACDSRTYLYLTPTYAFSPIEEVVNTDYRIDEATRKRVNEVLSKFVGSHYYHNYTSGKYGIFKMIFWSKKICFERIEIDSYNFLSICLSMIEGPEYSNAHLSTNNISAIIYLIIGSLVKLYQYHA